MTKRLNQVNDPHFQTDFSCLLFLNHFSLLFSHVILLCTGTTLHFKSKPDTSAPQCSWKTEWWKTHKKLYKKKLRNKAACNMVRMILLHQEQAQVDVLLGNHSIWHALLPNNSHFFCLASPCLALSMSSWLRVLNKVFRKVHLQLDWRQQSRWATTLGIWQSLCFIKTFSHFLLYFE